jgi:uncharacterized membrane protein
VPGAGGASRMIPFLLGALALVISAAAVVTAPWGSVSSNERSHVWWGAVAIATLAWIMQPDEQAGLRVHFLGATLLYLMFGARLALVALAVAGAGATLAGHGTWADYLPGLFVGGVVPVAASRLVFEFSQRRLPANVFVYIFVAGFAAGGIATLAAETAALVTADASISAPWGAGTLAVLALLLAFAEATLTGMIVSILVAYRPGWLASFTEARYLAPPHDRAGTRDKARSETPARPRDDV